MRDALEIVGIIAGGLVLVAGFIGFLLWAATSVGPSDEDLRNAREVELQYYTTCVESGGSYSESAWDGSPQCEKGK